MAKFRFTLDSPSTALSYNGLRRMVSLGLGTSAGFLAFVAVMLNSPSLFYMGTALVATIAACRVQAWLSVRGLRFERLSPESVRAGDSVVIEILVWSERRIRRPLVTVVDRLPKSLPVRDRTLSMPIAPSIEEPIRTQYTFRPMKRGKYRWNTLRAMGTDALGLVSMDREYRTSAVELTVLPSPIPVAVELPAASGWGISEAESGQSRGAGLEPRGVREYASGDSLRHVHWRSSARAGQLLVKEFEAGSHAAAAFLIQRTQGSEIGKDVDTTLELMCGHCVFLAEQFVREGSRVDFPLLEKVGSLSGPGERIEEIYQLLAGVAADQRDSLGTELLQIRGDTLPGSAVFLMLAVADPDLPGAIRTASSWGLTVVPLVYDANAFVKKGLTKLSAASPSYLDELHSAGASPILMPTVGVAG